MAEQWQATKAVRRDTKITFAICGPGGSGKTMSAMRIATGMCQELGKRFAVIDTENGRSEIYSDRFDFDRVPFDPPFHPLRYLDAIRWCAAKGYGVVVIDSASLWWDGEGGVLDMHAQDVERRMERARESGEKKPNENNYNMIAWAYAKAPYKRLCQDLGRSGVHLIPCFRAQEKLEVQTGKAPKKMGWSPVAGDLEVYACTLAALLTPTSQGVPMWINKDTPDQRVVKMTAEPFKWIEGLTGPLNEEVGRRIARWCRGQDAELFGRIAAARTMQDLEALVEPLKAADDKDRLRALWAEARRRITAGTPAQAQPATQSTEPPQAEPPPWPREKGVDID